MSKPIDLPKAYAPGEVEEKIFADWEASGAFDPERLPERNQRGEPYCIVLPPPNRTGTLHVGHAKMLAILGPCVGRENGYEVTEVADQEPWKGLRG